MGMQSSAAVEVSVVGALHTRMQDLASKMRMDAGDASAEPYTGPLVSAVGILAAIYAIFFFTTLHVRHDPKLWGANSTAERLWSVSQVLLGRILGLSFNVVFDGSPPRPYTGTGVVGAASPHGALPITQAGFGMFLFRLDPDLATFKVRTAGASLLFFIPVVRELLMLLGARDAAKSTLRRALDQGYSVAINPGGNYEMASTSHDNEVIYCQSGLGFVKLAMAAGKPLLPMYCFGENQCYHTYSFGLQFRRWVAQRLRVGFPIFTDRFGLLYGPPLPTHCTLVVGRAIECEANPNPTPAEVDAVFARYVEEVARLWSENAKKYLPAAVAERGLRIERIGVGVVKTVQAK